MFTPAPKWKTRIKLVFNLKTEVFKCCNSSKKILTAFYIFFFRCGDTIDPTEEVRNCATDWYEHDLSSYTCWFWRPEGRETISIVIHRGKIHLKSNISVFGWKPIMLQTGRLFCENTVASCIHWRLKQYSEGLKNVLWKKWAWKWHQQKIGVGLMICVYLVHPRATGLGSEWWHSAEQDRKTGQCPKLVFKRYIA